MRIALALFGVFSVVFLPPWVPLIVIVLLSLRYRAWEAVAIGLALDLLWQGAAGFTLPYCTLGAIVIVWLLEPVRMRLLS